MAEMKSSPHQLRARRFSSKKERKASPSGSPVEERRRSSVKRNDPFMKAHSSEVVGSEEDTDGTLLQRSFSSPGRKRSVVRKLEDLSYLLHNPKNVQTLRELLLRPGINPNALNEKRESPLHSIVRCNRADKVELIATLFGQSGADIDLKSAQGLTPLHLAVKLCDLACAKALVAFGASLNETNDKEQTPLDLATLAWIAKESKKKIFNGTNNLESTDSKPASGSTTERPSTRSIITDLSSSWVVVDQVNGSGQTSRNSSQPGSSAASSCNGEEEEEEEVQDLSPILERSFDLSSLNSSMDDARDFTNTMMPIRLSQMNEEVERVESKPFEENDPLDLMEEDRIEMLQFLYSVGAVSSAKFKKFRLSRVPMLHSMSESLEFSAELQRRGDKAASLEEASLQESELEQSIKLGDYDDGKTVLSLFEELEDHINLRMESQQSLSSNPDEAIALAMQQKELVVYKRTRKAPSPPKASGIGFKVQGGSRILFLDGGGIKGLVQLEILSQIEEATGRRITELFDWIVGTSTGGILALGMVYAKKSLSDLRQLYFRLKDEVFANPRGGFAYNTKALQKILQEILGTEKCMCDVTQPKLLIAAVNKQKSPPTLHFFNNCFNNAFSSQPVWKVARYTSAAPMFFKEFENYVDGGVLANNPCDYGLTAIQNYHRERGLDLPISLVVSVGTGIYPAEELGRVDAHEFLFFGKHWFSFTDTLKRRAQSLISLLSNALVESEIVASNCSTRCAEQGIPFYRFSPQLSEVIAAGETDMDKLIPMILEAKRQTHKQGLGDLVQLFQLVAEASRKLQYITKRRTSVATQSSVEHL